MGIGWAAAALVCGMAVMVLLGLVLVTADGRTGRVWPRVAGVVAGGLVVAGCAWLTISPVRAETDDGPLVCMVDREDALDASCRTAVTQRRVLVFTGLGAVGLAGAWLLLRPSRSAAGPGAGSDDEAAAPDPSSAPAGSSEPAGSSGPDGPDGSDEGASGEREDPPAATGGRSDRRGGARRAAPPPKRRSRSEG